MAFGVTPTGFVKKALTDIVDEMQADLRALVSAGLNLETVSPTGQILGTIAGQLSKVWDVAEETFHASRPSASGFALDGVAALTGTTRRPGTPSTVTLTLTLNAGVTVPALSRVAVAGDASRVFRLRAAATNPGAVPANIDAIAEAEEAGPTVANTGTLTVIADSVAGWTAVTNAADATLGQEIALDAELRATREEELATGGNSTTDAIRADLLKVSGVTSVQVVENDSDATVDSIPAHSLEAIVVGGDDTEVLQALLRAKSASSGTYGNLSDVVADDYGNLHTVYITRPTPVNIWVVVTISGYDPLAFPGNDAVIAALVGYQETRPPGTDVMIRRLIAQVLALPGIAGRPEADVTMTIGTAPAPVGTANIAITSRQIADLDSSRITINFA